MFSRLHAAASRGGSILIVLAAALTTASSASATPILVDGSFSSNTNYGQLGFNASVAGWTSTGYNFVMNPTNASTGVSGDSGTIALWTPSNGSNNGFGPSPDGGNFIVIDPVYESGHTISQTVTGLTVGATETIDFYYAGGQQQGFSGANQEGFDVTFGGVTQDTPLLSNASEGFTGWKSGSFNFTATSTSEVLTFMAVGGPSGVPPMALLDGVSITESTAATPEPASLALLGTGLVAMGGLLTRRIRKA
jgi:hypothetical protein